MAGFTFKVSGFRFQVSSWFQVQRSGIPGFPCSFQEKRKPGRNFKFLQGIQKSLKGSGVPVRNR
jgi:hypothetical protein